MHASALVALLYWSLASSGSNAFISRGHQLPVPRIHHHLLPSSPWLPVRQCPPAKPIFNRRQFFLQDSNPPQSATTKKILQDYLSLLRPVTLIQAVGAWVVGWSVAPDNFYHFTKEWIAMLVVYLSYGVGMVANDCVDATLDGNGNCDSKSNRAIASGRIGVDKGWALAASLTAICLVTAFLCVSHAFGVWCTANIALMLLYAGGLQNILLVKNILVGWLCISPLWGATTLGSTSSSSMLNMDPRMTLLAATGFSLGVVREVLKDVEDVELDRGTKQTLPLWIGAKAAQRLSFAALGVTLAVLQSPPYRRSFASSPLYSIAWGVASMVCLRASLRPTIAQQQAGVKQSIYVLLVGLIGSMALAKAKQ